MNYFSEGIYKIRHVRVKEMSERKKIKDLEPSYNI